MIDYHEYIGDRVRVTDKDGDTFEGVIVSYEVGIVEDKDSDSIGIHQEKQNMAIEIPVLDIVSIEII